MPVHSPFSITYGVIGVGLMGMEHIRNLLALDNVLITCIADDHPDSLRFCLSQLEAESPTTFASIKTFTSAKQLFQANLCDLAIVATPNFTHYQILLDAYKHANPDMHILVEKPLCTTVQHCREIATLARQRDGLTFVGLEYSYMPPITRILGDTKKGVVGTVKMVAIREHRFPFLQKVRNWNRFKANSGGTFVEKCCHFFDLFNRILAPCAPVTVMASGAQDVNHLNEVYNGQISDIMDNGYVVIEYSEGKRACLDLCMFAEASHSQEEVCVVGDKGKLEAFLPQLEVRTGIREKHGCGNVEVEIVDNEKIRYRGHHYGSSYLEHMDIVEVVRAYKNGKRAESATSGLHGGMLSVAMGVAAQLSIDEKRVVRMDEILTREELAQAI